MAVVLVVGADRDTGDALCDALQPAGHRIVQAPTVQEPIDADLVVFDLAGVPDALDIVRRIKSSRDPAVASVRIGVVAARGGRHERLEAAIEGALLYIPRPVDRDQLRRDVARLLAGAPEADQRKHVQGAALRALVRLERSGRVDAHDRRHGGQAPEPSSSPSPSRSLRRRLGELNQRQLAVIEAVAASDTREEARLRLGISRSLLGATLRAAADRLHFASVTELVAAVRRELADNVSVGAPEDRSLGFEPIVSIATGRTVALEAVAGTAAADGGRHDATPAEWAVRAAADAAARWRQDEEWADVGVSVDVSGRRLALPEATGDILDALDEAGLGPDAVVLEVADVVDVATSEAAMSAWRALRRAGVRLCVDHFGTEKSALTSVLRLDVDMVKLDACLLNGPAAPQPDVVTGLVDLAGAFAPYVVADGVADRDLLSTLAAAGCHAVQGPLVGDRLRTTSDRVGVSSPELTIRTG